MREIVFDTETTGLDPRNGDRIVEVGCVELWNHIRTDKPPLRILIDPERSVSEATVRITGITNEMLRGQKKFAHIADELMAYFGDAMIVAHNAEFDRSFLNAELERIGRKPLPKERFIDSAELARKHRPGSPASLDAVCKRFNISLEGRELHGALKDAELLALAYLELRGGRERAFDFASADRAAAHARRISRLPRPTPLAPRITPAEESAHVDFIAGLGPNAVWKKYG